MNNYRIPLRSTITFFTLTLLMVIIARLKAVQFSENGRYYIPSGAGSSLPPEDIISSHYIDDEQTNDVQIKCSFLCYKEPKCVAFNFRIRPHEKHTMNCQLSSSTKQRYKTDEREWTFYRDIDATIVPSTNDNGNVINEFHANFTNLGASGRHGPISLGFHYVGKDHENMVTVRNGTQLWTVPYTGTYEITAVGAAGGYDVKPGSSVVRGRGTYMKGEFALNKGGVLKVLVGQEGVENTLGPSSGGGGGSFVATLSNIPLIVAGGGGGIDFQNTRLANCDASIGTSGRQNQCKSSCAIWSGGVNGSGALEADGTSSGGGGGGLYSNGRSSTQFGGAYGKGGEGGRGFIQGGAGGRALVNNAVGGFGGGGGAFGDEGGAGGGGGYSGGASGYNAVNACGGGAGSYNIGKNQVNKEEFRANGHGYVEIKRLA